MDDETRHPHDISGKHINDERHINEALPCTDVSKISHPQLVRTFCTNDGLRGHLRQRFPADGSADLLPRRTPAGLITAMRRATVHLATLIPSVTTDARLYAHRTPDDFHRIRAVSLFSQSSRCARALRLSG